MTSAEQYGETRYLSFVGDFVFDSIRPFLDVLDGFKSDRSVDRIELTLISSGGYFYSAFAVFDYIGDYSKPVDIIATGCCQSSALLVLQAGRNRLSRLNTQFMIHRLEHQIPDYRPLSYIQSQIQDFSRQEDEFCKMLARRTNMSREQLKQMCDTERVFTPQEAVHLGIIDRIIE